MKAKILKIILATTLLISLTGCGSTRVVFVDTQADLVRIGPVVTGRSYILKDGEWILSKNKLKLPEGWYAGGIPREE